MQIENSKRQHRINKEKRQRQAGGAIFLIILAGFLFCIGHGVYESASTGIMKMLLEYQPATYGEVERAVAVKSMVVRSDLVVTAPRAGRFENVVLDHQRVRQGTVVGQLYPDDGGSPLAIRAPTTGMVVFTTDGLEKVLASFNFKGCGTDIFSYQSQPRSLVGEEVPAGGNLFKIVDNLSPVPVVVAFRLANFPQPWQSGSYITLALKDKRYRAEVLDLKGSGGTGMALLSLPPDDGLVQTRFPSFSVICDREEGVTVPAISLVDKDNQTGVYVLQDDRARFCPVTVKCRNQSQAVVDGIETGDLVVTTPRRVVKGFL